ncbi:MAG: outer membrane protein assembly factor BamD [Bacteroidota bacterium]|nr:outer membrane protein assembly factor BamD [Bacteroidota bacterium]MDP4234391.1 outer membrane protein assembly factor BamD [Bacteroidota bacterium]MDP4243324.1 outer membrane protein assembly factor BamD [Bacteroidota bacterium]MDP4288009.1 outer membrane protein assembly factor BamD [Bacteroidota bacterium]
MNYTRTHTLYTGLAGFLLSFFLFGCGSGSDQMAKPTPVGTADKLFTDGKAAYAKEDWPEAIRLFEEVRVQSPASNIAAEATYFEAMARFNSDMFSGAALDFHTVRRNYPNSPYASRAQYMAGESYYQISPRPDLDQSYTTLALSEYQIFLRDYPKAPPSLIDSAQKRIIDIRSKLAEKFILAAQLYDKLDDPKSSLVYYNRVLDSYYDTRYAPESELRIAEIQFDRKKMEEAKQALDAFDAKYLREATTDQRQRALKLRSKLPNQ